MSSGKMPDATVSIRAEFPVLRPMPTRWMDNDEYGHVNNVTYYSYFDSAINAYLMEAAAIETRTLPAIGIVAETSCRFFKEVSFPDLLHIGLRIEKLGHSSAVYQLAVFRAESIEASAIGRFVHVYVDRVTRRPVSIPRVIRAVLEKL